MDILVDIGSKVLNIEVNVRYDNYRTYRNFFYLASSTIESMKKDKKFVDVKEHVQFNFNFQKEKKKAPKRIKKIGRNESCPCGSGKKYKQCCGK